MSKQFDELSLAEKELAVAEQRAAELAEKKRHAEALKQLNESHEENKRTAFLRQLRSEFRAIGLEPSPDVDPDDFDAVTASALRYEIQYDGTFRVKNQATGQYADTASALRGLASDSKYSKYFSQDSIKRLQTSPANLTKSQMTPAMKARYISEHGVEAFSRIPPNPATPEPPIEEMNADVYRNLPTQRKTEIINTMGVEWVERMLATTRRRY